MAVVIRLQGLRVTAGSEDIRSFFTGLKIPDGGVHIIGGHLEQAFIIFASDEDARRAMTRSGGCIKGCPVHLLLSSKTEMQNVLEASTRKPEVNNRRMYKESVRRPEMDAAPSPLGENMAVEIRRTDHPEMGSRSGLAVHNETHNQTRNPEGVKSWGNNGLYVHMFGMPFSTTKSNVRLFFDELQVVDMLFLRNQRGTFNGCAIVKFATVEDATEGLKRNRKYIGTRFVLLTTSTEQQWLKAGGGTEPATDDILGYDTKQSSISTQRKYASERPRSRSPVAYRSRSSSPSNEEYCVMMENLCYSVEKRDLKAFLHPISLKDDQMIHVLDKYGKNSRTAFVVFRSLRDYCAGLAHQKEELANRTVYVSPISKEKMVAMLELSKHQREDCKRSSKSAERQRPQKNVHDSEKVCLYVRNLPFDVRKVEIMDFFHGFRLSEDNVVLLRDDKGVGLGEALLVFQKEQEAAMAQSLNGQRFLGSEVMLKCISRAQMEEFGVKDQPVERPRERSSQRTSRHSEARDRMYSHDTSGVHVPLPDELPGYGHASRFDHPRDAMFLDVVSDVHCSPPDDVTVYAHGKRFDSSLDYPDGNRVLGRAAKGFGPSGQQFDGPTCLKLLNLPFQITIDEIYDFCHGYRVIAGSVSLQYDRNGVPKGSATVVFESHSEAITAVNELSGRPIGTRKIKIVFV